MVKTVLTVAFVGLLSAEAAAQTPLPAQTTDPAETIDSVRKDYRVHLGPFYVKPALLVKELGVDTNVFNQTDQPKSDFTTTVTPQADVAVPFAHRGLFRVMGGLDSVYYAKYATERS